MRNTKMAFRGILAAVLIMILTSLAATAETTKSSMEINLAGMTFVGNEWIDSIYLGRIGFGYCTKGIGFELGIVGAPWYEGFGAFFDGSFVMNPFFDKPISPVIRVGALTSTVGGFIPLIGGGMRFRLAPKFGLRAEYTLFVPSTLGAVTVGAFMSF